ncbi:MAG: hypothetical protein JKY67_02005 [Pseudomonadales bacterium]|nr:hypothetical protein [Pseudomonadales bacterium]
MPNMKCLLSSSCVSFVVVCIVTIACLFYLGGEKLSVGITPHGDFAADMLVMDKIGDNGYLLTGHYSRFQFNHPGPFFFYVAYLFDKILVLPVTSPSMGVFVSILTLNGIFMLLAVVLVMKLFSKRLKFWPMLTSVLIVIGYMQHDLHSAWMPYRIILPYLAFIVSLVLLARREFIYFPLACLLASILVHGYVSMVILALPLVFVFSYFGYRQQPGALTRRDKIYVMVGLLIGLFFSSPMLIDVVISDSPNLGKIIHQSLTNNFSSPKFVDIIQETNKAALKGFNLVYFGIILLGSGILIAGEKGRVFWQSLMITFSCLTVLFLVYHKNVPGPIYDNMVLFSKTIPMALVMICSTAVFCSLENTESAMGFRSNAYRAIVVLLCIASVLHLRPIKVSRNDHVYIKTLASEMKTLTTHKEGVRLDYSDHGQWPDVVALLYELKQREYPVCSTWRNMAFLYTPEMICNDNLIANIKLVPKSQCNDDCNYMAGNVGIIKLN